MVNEEIKVPDDFVKEINDNIAVNQVAYGLGEKKIAITRGDIDGDFYVCDENENVVFSGKCSKKKFDSTNGVYVRHLDFSALDKCGKYYIKTKLGVSYPFEISQKPYAEITDAMIKALYFQRCGMDLDEKYAGKWAHKACHNWPAFDITNPSRVFEDVSGGWHDAGDFGKYITPANQTVFNMMAAYELFPNGVSDKLNIPESDNEIPDILNEAKYELDWMLKMQEPDGSVHHKVTTVCFAGSVMPDDDKLEDDYAMDEAGEQYLKEHPEIDEKFVKSHQCMSQIAMPATAGFAAAMAMAARVYKKFLPKFADKCMSAAKLAYDFAIANYKEWNGKGFDNIKPVRTGGYGDTCCLDEVYWATAEMFKTTGDKKYEEDFRVLFNTDGYSKTSFGAYHQAGHGSLSYVTNEIADKDLKAKVLEKVVESADDALTVYNRNSYLLCLHDGVNRDENEYYWGSNAALTNKLGNVITAAIALKTDKYDQMIKDSISYMLGRNYISTCYVTGFGTKNNKNPHHRPSMFDKIDEPVPGLVAGGPNDRKWQRPSVIKGVRQSEGIDWDNMPPAGCYIDWEWNWTTNEVTIYWNSSCFYVTGYLNSLK